MPDYIFHFKKYTYFLSSRCSWSSTVTLSCKCVIRQFAANILSSSQSCQRHTAHTGEHWPFYCWQTASRRCYSVRICPMYLKKIVCHSCVIVLHVIGQCKHIYVKLELNKHLHVFTWNPCISYSSYTGLWGGVGANHLFRSIVLTYG